MLYHRSRFYLTALICFALGILLAACGDSSSHQFIPPEPDPQLPPGQYSTVLTGKDIAFRSLVPPDYGTAGRVSSPYAGNWELTLDKDNHYTIVFNGEVLVEGSYRLTSDKIAFTSSPSTGSFSACPADDGTQGEAIYNWNLAGGTLVLSQIYEDCIVRGIALQTHPLKMS